MFIFPINGRSIQSLSQETKNEIARRVAEKVYFEMRNNNYLESGYIFEVANEIAKAAMNFEFVRLPDSDGYQIKILSGGIK